MKEYASNKKAYFDYEILDQIEAGMLLNGWEVKSIKAANVSLKESYIKFHKGMVFVTGMHVAKWKQAGKDIQMDETRDRKLLLNKKEIGKVVSEQQRSGFAVIPLKIYANERGYIKLLIGIGRGKKKFDKRTVLKAKDQKREIERDLAGRR